MLEQVINQASQLIQELGRNTLSSLYPDDFEAYIIGLELTSSTGETLDYLTFPISPQSISYSYKSLTNIKMTSEGLSIIKSTNKVPSEISLQGDFGRNFKMLLGSEVVNLNSLNFSIKKTNLAKTSFSKVIKTGYGSIKLLEKILKDSQELDDNYKSKKLYFHNPSLGQTLLVEFNRLQLTQSRDKNAIPSYSVQLTGLLQIEANTNITNNGLGAGLLQNKITKLGQFVAKTISTKATSI